MGSERILYTKKARKFGDGHRERYHTARKYARDLYAIERKDGADAHAWDPNGFYIAPLNVEFKYIGMDGWSICVSISNPIGYMYAEWEWLRIRISN